jgi:uncharacterized protein YaaW (UPF0174 family)
MGILGVASTGGFSTYVAASTALGFVTQIVGVTLPFAAYTGLSSTIAFTLGPAGWLGAGAWALWNLTDTDWKKLTPALIYLSTLRNQKNLLSHQK